MSLCTLVYSIILVVTVDSESDDHTFLLQPNTVGCGEDNLIRLEVPKGVIKKDVQRTKHLLWNPGTRPFHAGGEL